MKRLIPPVSYGLSFLVVLSLLSLMDSSFGAVSSGQKLFQANCLRCHGYNAQGSLSAAKTLKVDPSLLDLTREAVARKALPYLERRIADGHGKMPQHRQRFSPSEIRSLAQYVLSLQKAYAFRNSKPE